MRAEGVAILIVLILGIGVIGMLAMPMFDKIPKATGDPAANATAQNLTQPLTVGFGLSLSSLEITLAIGAIIGVCILIYKGVYDQ